MRKVVVEGGEDEKLFAQEPEASVHSVSWIQSRGSGPSWLHCMSAGRGLWLARTCITE